jgi:hypothetical protein
MLVVFVAIMYHFLWLLLFYRLVMVINELSRCIMDLRLKKDQ